MTSKMICPFCRRALARHSVQGQEYGICRGENCPSKRVFLPIEIWQALIQAKQDLKIATKALSLAKWWLGSSCIASAEKAIDKALERIEHKDENNE